MKIICVKHLSKRKVILASCIAMLVSFPAFAAPQLAQFVQFSTALVIGISLPVLFLSIIFRKALPNPWYFFIGVTGATLAFLAALVYQSDNQAPALLTYATAFLALTYIWPFTAALKNNEKLSSGVGEYFSYSVQIIAVISTLYVLTVWFFPRLDAYIGWLIASCAVLMSGATFIVVQTRQHPEDVVRLVVQWLMTAVFISTMFFWQNAQLSLLGLVASFLVLYFTTLVNGHWSLIRAMLTQVNNDAGSGGLRYNSEDLFSFTHDPATNLPSYQQALIRLEQLFKQDNRKRYAVVVIKPGNFEHVNQVLGHQNSDILLLQLAYCLQRKIASNDNLINFDYTSQASRLARLQSLHFLTVIDVTNSHYPERIIVEDLCRQLADAVPDAMSFKSFSLNFELSCGVAFTGEHGKSITEVIAHAGDAVLKAERERKLVQYYDEQESLYTEQHLLKMERLKQDIENDALQWVAQPVINNKTKQIHGFSLQVRWRYLSDEYIELKDFIEIAENSGELYVLSKQMIKQAFKLLFELKKINFYRPISVSLSSTDILEPDIADYIEENIKQYNIAGKYLMVELTEPVMVVACDRAKSMVDQLKMLEVGISIDDFTGSYESLRYIRKLSVDQIKISCEHLGAAGENSAEKAIVNSLVNLARTMKLPFVGSNIDTKEVQGVYEIMGGNILKGNVISSGVPIKEMPEWIEQWYRRYPQGQTKLDLLDI